MGCGGDFNVVRFPRERSREGRFIGARRSFSKIVDALEMDLPLQGGRSPGKEV